MEKSDSLIILGNGHNLGMGLRTSYANFAEHYMCDISKYPDSKLYKYLCTSFHQSQNHKQLWGDLENEIFSFVTTVNWQDCNIQEECKYFERLRDNLDFYMDGEAKYKLLGGLYNAIEGMKDSCSIMDTLPVVLLRLMLLQNKRYDIISFNYSCLEYILYKIASEIQKIDNSLPFDNNQIVSYYQERINLNYVHISGKKCVLGTHNDKSIPDAFSFVKKVSQISCENVYPKKYSQYKTIIIYGHSMGESDSDFVKVLFEGFLHKSKRYNPRFIFVVKENKSKIYDNLTSILRVKLNTINKHIRISFINVGNNSSKKLLHHCLI